MKNTILISTAIYPPDIGGPATFIKKLERQLVKSDYNVVIIGLIDDKKYKFGKEGNVERIFIPRNNNYIFRTLRIIKTMIVKSRQSNAVFVNGLFIESAISLIFSKKPAISKFVGDPVWERYQNKNKTTMNLEEFFRSKSSLLRNILIFIYKKSFAKFQTIIFPSNYLAAFFKNIYSTKNTQAVIYNGIASSEHIDTSTNFSREWDLIILSRLVKWKNIDLVLQNLENSNLKIIVVGDGSELRYLKRLSNRSELNIFFSGKVSHEKSLEYLRKSKIFVQISSYEGFSHSLLEAMSLGLLCIVSNIPAHREIIRNKFNGILVDLVDVTKLKEIILDILQNQELVSSICLNAKKTVAERFTDEISINNYLKEINRMLDN